MQNPDSATKTSRRSRVKTPTYQFEYEVNPSVGEGEFNLYERGENRHIVHTLNGEHIFSPGAGERHSKLNMLYPVAQVRLDYHNQPRTDCFKRALAQFVSNFKITSNFNFHLKELMSDRMVNYGDNSGKAKISFDSYKNIARLEEVVVGNLDEQAEKDSCRRNHEVDRGTF